MYEFVLFDLDGTLTDPALGITNSLIYGLKKWGIEPPEREKLYKFIGPPLAEAISEEFSLTLAQAEEVVEYYREYFSVKGLFENTLYDGIKPLLAELKERGCRLALATSKPLVFAEKILRHFEIYDYFEVVAGATLDGKVVHKNDVIKEALSLLGTESVEDVIMVGDRRFDVEGAASVGIGCIGVGYGYGSEEELRSAGAVLFAPDVAALREILQ